MAKEGRMTAEPRALVLALVSCSMLLSAAPGVSGNVAEEPHWVVLIDSVDAGRMMETVEALQDFGSREFHLESSREAAKYLHESFEAIGLDVGYQQFHVGDTLVSNVVATLGPASEGGSLYLVGAHYDSENSAVKNLSAAENITAPGADDDASGIAVMLEIARILASSAFDAKVKFVAFGAEEYGYDDSGGCKGSQYFASQEAAAGVRYDSTAILDMVGYRNGTENKAVMVVNDMSYPLAMSMSESVDRFSIDLALENRYGPEIVYSDHASFWAHSMPSMLIVEELDPYKGYPVNPYYHTSMDTADRISPEQLEAVAKALLGGLLLMEGGSDGFPRELVFGIVIMSVAAVSVALALRLRRRQGRVEDDR